MICDKVGLMVVGDFSNFLMDVTPSCSIEVTDIDEVRFTFDWMVAMCCGAPETSALLSRNFFQRPTSISNLWALIRSLPS